MTVITVITVIEDLRVLAKKPFAKGNAAKWLPWPGRHVVQLVDDKGAKLDEIKLEVRGAGVRTALR